MNSVAIMFLVVVLVIVVLGFVLIVVKWGLEYSENIERIKRGYPALNGDTPLDYDDQTEESRQNA